MYDKIKRWYECGLWTSEMVEQAASKKVITQDEAKDILGGEKNE